MTTTSQSYLFPSSPQPLTPSSDIVESLLSPENVMTSFEPVNSDSSVSPWQTGVALQVTQIVSATLMSSKSENTDDKNIEQSIVTDVSESVYQPKFTLTSDIQPTGQDSLKRPVITETLTANSSCISNSSFVCVCKSSSVQWDSNRVRDEKDKINQLVKSLKQELKVDKRNTSKFIRSKISADDKRKSSKAIGYTAVIILSILGTIVLGLDLINLLKMIMRCKNRISAN